MKILCSLLHSYKHITYKHILVNILQSVHPLVVNKRLNILSRSQISPLGPSSLLGANVPLEAISYYSKLASGLVNNFSSCPPMPPKHGLMDGVLSITK
jgi:hypothetical protein